MRRQQLGDSSEPYGLTLTLPSEQEERPLGLPLGGRKKGGGCLSAQGRLGERGGSVARLRGQVLCSFSKVDRLGSACWDRRPLCFLSPPVNVLSREPHGPRVRTLRARPVLGHGLHYFASVGSRRLGVTGGLGDTGPSHGPHAAVFWPFVGRRCVYMTEAVRLGVAAALLPSSGGPGPLPLRVLAWRSRGGSRGLWVVQARHVGPPLPVSPSLGLCSPSQ